MAPAIGIIGGTGGIGRWFADFFAREGFRVYATGRKSGLSLPDLASRCRVVIVAVPIAATREVIAEVGALLPAEALLMDFTSLKEEPVREMLAATRAEVVGCHPLFGPDTASLAGNNIVFCPARGESWRSFPEALFIARGARVVHCSPAEHDRMMALIQGLNHFNTLLMELTLKEAKIEEAQLERFSTPAFRAKRSLAAKLSGQSAGLYAAILAKNPNLVKIMENYEQNLAVIKGLIAESDAAGLTKLMKR